MVQLAFTPNFDVVDPLRKTLSIRNSNTHVKKSVFARVNTAATYTMIDTNVVISASNGETGLSTLNMVKRDVSLPRPLIFLILGVIRRPATFIKTVMSRV